jgi:oxalate---CoA ligase
MGNRRGPGPALIDARLSGEGPKGSHTRPAVGDIQAWLVSRVAEALEIEAGGLDVRLPLTSYGLESIDAFTIAGDLASWLDCELPATLLWEHPTVEQLARHLATGSREPCSSLVALQPHGSRPPFFCIHGPAGTVLFYQSLARHLGPDQPVYGFQAPIREEGDAAPLEIEAMASAYLRELRAFEPSGPYYLGGLSFGGIVAFEMARQLQVEGQDVAVVALMDSLCPRHARRLSLRRRLLLHGRNLLRLTPREQLRYVWTRALSVGAYGRLKAWDVAQGISRRAGSSLPAPFRHTRVLNHLAAKSYVPRPYPGQVTLFRAVERLDAADDPYRGWDQVALGGVEVHDVPGDHSSMIREPHVAVLAARLKACLERSPARDV